MVNFPKTTQRGFFGATELVRRSDGSYELPAVLKKPMQKVRKKVQLTDRQSEVRALLDMANALLRVDDSLTFKMEDRALRATFTTQVYL